MSRSQLPPPRDTGSDVRYRRLVEQIQDFAIFFITPDGRHGSWNAGVRRVLGYERDEFVGQPVGQIFVPEHVERGVPLNELEHARVHGSANDDRWMLKKGGIRFWASGVTTSLRDERGELLGFSKVLRDLTEQKALQDRAEASEAALRESEERLRLALTAARVGTWRLDLVSGRDTVDANLARMMELGEEDTVLTLDDFLARLHPEDRSRTRAAFDAAIRQRESLRVEFRVVCADGSIRWMRDHGEVIVDAAGEPRFLTGAAVDITEQREADERLAQSQRMEAVGKLAGGVAHEVNNMMSVVLGFTDFLLEEYRPGDRRRQDLEQVRTAAGRAASVTAQLLAFSRRQILQPTILRVGDTVEALRPVLARMLGEDKELVVRQADAGHVKADRGQLEQVVINLALNARDAMQHGGQLTIETADVTVDPTSHAQHPEATLPPGAYVMLALSDTGHGMDQTTLERIFEPFFTTKPTGQGTGLGLSVVHGIVHQSDGYIRPETAPGQGTTFRVYLPVASSPAERPARTTGPVVMPGHGETVLVAEDEPMVRSHVVRMLDRMGYTTVEAADGREALELLSARAAPVDLVLTDIVMPRLNGRDLATEISARWPDLPVLFMSGYADDEMSRRDLLTPEAPFIQKPFDSRGLAAKLGAMLRRD
jgi:two-component system cell cycle sensor histidine kinase/response regulator CckA